MDEMKQKKIGESKRYLSKFKRSQKEEDREEIEKKISQTELNELQRQILTMRFVDGMVWREIVDILYRDKRWLQRVQNRALMRFWDQHFDHYN